MNKKRRLILIACAILILAGVAYALSGRTQKPEYGKNLLLNGDFEATDGENAFQHWFPDAYVLSPGVSEYLVEEGQTGNGAKIENHAPNDARWMQAVSVLPSTVYCLEGDIMAAAEGGRGANLSVAGVYAFSDSVFASDGWQHVRMYGRTGVRQREVTVYARLGGYSGESAGSAVFDNVKLYAVQSVPEGAELFSWEKNIGAQPPEEKDEGEHSAWPVLTLTVLLYLAFAACLMRAAARGVLIGSDGTLTAVALLTAALLIRLLVALTVPGYQVDIGCFTAWANRMAEVGPSSFYLTDMHADYPPGYMLVLWPLGLLGRLLGGGTKEWMVKMPPILCDLAAVWLLYVKRPKKEGLWSLVPAVLYALNPLTVLTGAAWGQADSVTALLIVLTVLYAVEGRWIKALPIYMLAVLMKPQALMFGPLGLIALIADMLWNKEDKKPIQVLYGVGLALAVLVAVCLPFSLKQKGFDWLVGLYTGTMTYYDKATVNMTNLYFLFGLNWSDLNTPASFLLRLMGVMTVLVPLACYALRARKELDKRYAVMLAALSAVLTVIALWPLSVGNLGPVLMAVCFAVVTLQFIRGKDIRLLPLYGAVLLILFSTLGVMMHERYMFPALLLLFMAFALVRDVRILYLALLMTVPVFLNVGLVLDRAIRIGGVEGHLFAPGFDIESDTAWLEMALAVLHLATSATAVYVGFLISNPKTRSTALRRGALQDAGHMTLSFSNPQPILRSERKDVLIMLAVTLVYAVAALMYLGSRTAPQTAWVSKSADEQIVFDLGATRRFRVLYYPGIHWDDQTFTVLSGDDPENMTPYTAKADRGDCFSWRWQKTEPVITVHAGRYAGVRADSIGLTLMEIVFEDADTGERLPVTLKSGNGHALIDEQSTLQNEPMLFDVDQKTVGADGLPVGALRPSWYNSMYFDEIYHARTAYEQLNALKGREPAAIYETTHPPLGKVLMTLAVSIFGMTPFGWRFAGALAGVLMLPGMYVLGRLLTRRRWAGLLAMVLMACDCMHFAQTRIATIDSFVTLFIIWSTYFMCRYVLMDYYATPFKKTLVPLGLSGLLMGLAIASKWTGVYAGVGLAVMFFVSLYGRVQEGRAARKLLKDEQNETPITDRIRAAGETWDQRAVRTIMWCLLFFVAVPGVIYYLSFYPVFVNTYGGLSVKKVIDASVHMFNYHSAPGLGMDHPYYSPWYQWPVCQKPMWYYSSAKFLDTGSTIFAFGNPAVWWTGLAALLFILCDALIKRMKANRQNVPAERNVCALLVLVGFTAQYLPWVLVPRGTYIYHYFPSVPFLILAGALLVGQWMEKYHKMGRRVAACWMVLAFTLFIGFYPYVSGLRVPFVWLDMMRWLPGIWY